MLIFQSPTYERNAYVDCTKQDCFFCLCVNLDWKLRVLVNAERYIYNQFYNILRLFDILSNFPFTKSETIAIITYKHGIYELPYELANNLRLRILGN